MIYINPYSFGGFSNLFSNIFDGVNERATALDNSAFSFTNAGQDTAWSLVVSIKRSGTGVVMAKWTSGGNVEWEVNFTGGTLRFTVWNAAATQAIGRSVAIAAIPTGTWKTIAFTYTGSELASGIKIFDITGGVVTQIDTTNVVTGGYSGMTNGTSPLYFGAFNNGGVGSFYNGRLYHPQLWTGVLDPITDLPTIGANPRQDIRTFSFAATPISAWHYPNGTADYPTWTDYVNGRNATMTNQESTDINTDIP